MVLTRLVIQRLVDTHTQVLMAKGVSGAQSLKRTLRVPFAPDVFCSQGLISEWK